ncbi:nucleotidyltransferase domain-containing protein [Stieleria varia]|uniref:Putative nucleotidyltransferase n=1 Tax=Stieleria varia TaxID=2528005 RepID=A0A5C6AT69_9BACT|nr:putative nucleotidyltransferase [Stieleria varia]
MTESSKPRSLAEADGTERLGMFVGRDFIEIDFNGNTSVTEHSLIYSVGTQVVAQKEVMATGGRIAHPAGAVGVIVRSPVDRTHAYRVKFSDGFEAPIHHDQLIRLAEFKSNSIRDNAAPLMSSGLYDRVIYRCVIGSRAYGLEDEASDTDRRGIYLPAADLHWSLFGVPEQLENDETQEVYWELQKFIVLALKANPNVLECLYSPIVESATPLGEELLEMRSAFLSKLIFQTFSGYVASQFKKMQTDIRNQGRVKGKHVMHLIRLLLSGTHVLRSDEMMVDVGQHRDQLLTIKRGEMPFAEADSWRKELQSDFESAFQTTKLPDRPDYERANAFLVDARRRAMEKSLP